MMTMSKKTSGKSNPGVNQIFFIMVPLKFSPSCNRTNSTSFLNNLELGISSCYVARVGTNFASFLLSAVPFSRCPIYASFLFRAIPIVIGNIPVVPNFINLLIYMSYCKIT